MSQVLYAIALAASNAEVEAVITRIREDFQIDGVAPSTVAVQQATTTVAAAAAPTSEVDKNGFPWNEVIHSSSKALNADGTWRKKKGVDAGTVARVEAQMRGGAAPAPAPTAVPTPVAVNIPTIAIPGANVPKSKYQQFTDFLAANTAPVGKLNPDFITAVFETNGTNLAALASADEATIQAFWDAIAGTLNA